CEEMVTMGVDMVQLTGGEPLIYPGVDAIIEFFIQRDIRLSITTSGIVNSPKTNQAIARMKGTGGWVQVSLDGLEDTHNQMRGNRHGYSSAVAFIQ
ncbi:MAG: radical SAM protein, partial [Anaerolineales bacterium]|nr:radical SAM protein [Anaerolineales bacterium]